MIYPAWNVQCYLDPAVICFDFDHFPSPVIGLAELGNTADGFRSIFKTDSLIDFIADVVS